MWRSQWFSKRTKILVTAFATPLFIAVLVSKPPGTSGSKPQTAKTNREEAKKPETFWKGDKVTVAKGSTVYADAEMLKTLATARQQGDSAAIDAALQKLSAKTEQVGDRNMFIVVKPMDGGVYCQLERDSPDGPPETWYAEYADMTRYISPEEARFRAAEAQIEKERQDIEGMVKDKFRGKLKVDVSRIRGGPSERLFNLEIRIRLEASGSAASMKRSVEMEMRDVYEWIFTNVPRALTTWCFVESEMIDKFGKESIELVYKTSMGKGVADRIHWKKKDSLDFTNLWETHFLHRALTKE